MDISTLTLKLIILLVPGIISNKIYRRLVIRHKESTDLMFIVTSVVFGLISYLILNFTIYRISGLESFNSISESTVINYNEVFFASIVSVLVGYLGAFIDNGKWINKIAHYYDISQKYGDENLFTRWLNRDIEWVYIRDKKADVTYLGRICYFSETPEFKEIGLDNVTVYSFNDSEELYSIPEIYLCFKSDNLTIEQAIINKKHNEK